MKTLMTANGSPIRVKDTDAVHMVNGTWKFKPGDYYYCPKAEWKKIRPRPKNKK
jgi:hypothetical protein